MRCISWVTCVLVVVVMAVGGCGSPSLLVTPVTSKRALVETELMRDSLFASDKIAVIDVSGVIRNSPGGAFFSQGEHPVSLLLEQLDKARRDRKVKAVILRINSPGGTAVASELMHDEIKHFKKKTGKPVVAVMMDVAASGGYYIACACDEIVAQPSTVTGSIGVVMQMFDLTGTMKLIGVEGDAITSGTYKDAGSPLRAMRTEERELFQTIVNDMHDRFIGVVAKGRPQLDEEAVRSLADGRIYTAGQALELGLIDRITTIRQTIRATKKRVGSKKVRVVAYHRPVAHRPNYYASAPLSPSGDINLINVDLPTWLDRTTPQFMYLWYPLLHP
ncbi:MAG: signal peptide peptidase SppA [Planctomycetota bacterium]|jgi:protease-4